MSRKKQEREAESRGRKQGLIDPEPLRRPDDWIYTWEERDAEAIEYARALVRPYHKRPCEEWPAEITAAVWALFVVATGIQDVEPRAMPFLRRLHVR